MENHRYPKKCYLMLLHLDERGSSTWASYVKNIIFSYGFGHVWLNQGVGNEGHFIEIFKQRVYDMAQQKWCADVNSFDKPRSYSQFKSQLNLEKYIAQCSVYMFSERWCCQKIMPFYLKINFDYIKHIHFVQISSFFISLMTKIIHFLMYWTLLPSIKIRIPWTLF